MEQPLSTEQASTPVVTRRFGIRQAVRSLEKGEQFLYKCATEVEALSAQSSINNAKYFVEREFIGRRFTTRKSPDGVICTRIA